VLSLNCTLFFYCFNLIFVPHSSVLVFSQLRDFHSHSNIVKSLIFSFSFCFSLLNHYFNVFLAFLLFSFYCWAARAGWLSLVGWLGCCIYSLFAADRCVSYCLILLVGRQEFFLPPAGICPLSTCLSFMARYL